MCEDLISGKRSLVEVFHPGVFIKEEIVARGWSIETLALKSGLRRDVIEELMACERPITPILALCLEAGFGVNRQCWMRLQAAFDESG